MRILAIGGMTCSACVNAIRTSLVQLPCISSVDVNLFGNSASVTFEHKHNSDGVKEAIKYPGYDATLNSLNQVLPMHMPNASRRKVAFYITGMYCERYPPLIAEDLQHFQGDIVVGRMPTIDSPILYDVNIPKAPELTIRTVISSISEAYPALEVCVLPPPNYRRTILQDTCSRTEDYPCSSRTHLGTRYTNLRHRHWFT